MSESNEKQINEVEVNEQAVDTKAAREQQQRKAEKRSSVMYAVIAVAFVIVAAITLIWRSNIIPKTATAAIIDGEKYTAAEVSFYYENMYQNFLGSNYYYMSYLGINPALPMQDQIISEEVAEMMGCEAGISWYDFLMDQSLRQMAAIQETLAEAEASGHEFNEAKIAADCQETMASLATTAASMGATLDEYLKSNYCSTMTEEIYVENLIRVTKYTTYVNHYIDSLTYTEDEIQAAYDADPKLYDLADYEYVTFSGVAESTTDADGNTVEPTEEESAAALAAAKEMAEELLANYKAGGNLEELAAAYGDDAVYIADDAGMYYGTVLTEWLFDDARKSGDCELIENGTAFYVAVFHDRYLNDGDTVDVRHILITPEIGEISMGEEGYDEQQEAMEAEAKAYAEELLAQWESGEASEESFAALAIDHSTDTGSNTVGGLYEGVQEGQMVEEFNDWCFDVSRKSGDTGIVETTFGYHIMYFVGDNLPAWQYNASATLRDEEGNAWLTSFGTDAEIIKKDLGMKFVG